MKEDHKAWSSHIVKSLRELAKLNQRELAELMNVAQSAISRAESKGCGIDHLFKTAKACDTKIDLVISANKKHGKKRI